MGVSPSSNDSEIDTLSIVRLCRFYHEDFKVMGVSPSSNDSEIDTLSIVRLCRFYHEDFKVVMPVCTQ